MLVDLDSAAQPTGDTVDDNTPFTDSALRPEVLAEAATLSALGRAISEACGGQSENVLQLECHLDHLTGEEIGAALEILSHMPEVLDVLWLSGVGKKNRPCGVLRVLCMPAHGPKVGAATVRHTHSLGLRWQLIGRTVLPRRTSIKDGMPAKSYVVEGQEYVRIECDALKGAAEGEGVGLVAMRTR